MTLLAGGACADDAPSLTTTSETDTDDGTTTTGTPPVTTIDPDSSGGTSATGDSGESESSTGSTGADSTDGGAVCGNGTIEDGEDCDGKELGGADCASQGFEGGDLFCGEDCTFDTSSCTGGTLCGNGTVEGDEQCDGRDFGGATCASEGFEGGRLGCADDCTLDTSGCMNAPTCGNGAIDAPEVCDGANLDGETCVSQGFAGGTLACAADCTGFDTSSCMAAPTCGNGAIDAPEACDGGNLGGETCVSQGFGGGGVLACAADCGSFDTSGCIAGPACAHPVCDLGVALTQGCDPCVTQVCAFDDYCCSTDWDAQCVGEANVICGAGCPVFCGNNVAETGEACDTIDLGGETCVSQGFAGGVLACAADCGSFDTSGCLAGPGCAHPVCDVGIALTQGCDPCVDQVCAFDGFCCNNSWDEQCVGEANVICGAGCPVFCGNNVVEAGETCDTNALAGETCATQGFVGGALACAADCGSFDTSGCFAGGVGDCCAPHPEPGCQDPTCEAAICGADAYCCDNEWDSLCAGDALASPACVGAGGSCGGGGPPDFSCAEAVGVPGANVGSNVGGDSDVTETCGAGGGPETTIQFTATVSGVHTFDAIGSDYDTVIAAFLDCNGVQLTCNDDFQGNPLCGGMYACSQVSVDMTAGDTILISIAGFSGATGNWVVNITEP